MPYTAPIARVVDDGFVENPSLPYGLTTHCFRRTIEDLYEYLQTVNTTMVGVLGMDWTENIIGPATFTTVLSDFFQASLGTHCPGLVVNTKHNGHPDLVPPGVFPGDGTKSGDEGVEVKVSKGIMADMHGARNGYLCLFNYWRDDNPVLETRKPTRITKVFVAKVDESLFRRNERKSELSTHTSSLNRDGLEVLRAGAVYLDPEFNKQNRRSERSRRSTVGTTHGTS